MEFWGVEVKPGQTLKVELAEDEILHLSQASLGEVKKHDEANKGSIHLYVKNGDQTLVVGTLSADKCTQITYDLTFEKEFDLSHNSKNGSIYFFGYKSFVDKINYTSDDYYDSIEAEEGRLNLLQRRQKNMLSYREVVFIILAFITIIFAMINCGRLIIS